MIITSHRSETQFRNWVSSVESISSFPEMKPTFSPGFHHIIHLLLKSVWIFLRTTSLSLTPATSSWLTLPNALAAFLPNSSLSRLFLWSSSMTDLQPTFLWLKNLTQFGWWSGLWIVNPIITSGCHLSWRAAWCRVWFSSPPPHSPSSQSRCWPPAPAGQPGWTSREGATPGSWRHAPKLKNSKFLLFWYWVKPKNITVEVGLRENMHRPGPRHSACSALGKICRPWTWDPRASHLPPQNFASDLFLFPGKPFSENCNWSFFKIISESYFNIQWWIW